MRIGLFTDTYFPQINGIASSVNTLAAELRALGHTVYIFTPSAPKAEKADFEVRMPSMPVFFIPPFRCGLIYPPHVLKKIAGFKLDIIHTQTEFSLGVFGKMLSKALNLPHVHTYHTMYEDYIHYLANGHLVKPSAAKELTKVYCNHTNVLIAPTDKVYNYLRHCEVKKPISVIPTGINIDKFRKSNFNKADVLSLKESLGISADNTTALFIGRVAKEKSVDVIINSMPELITLVPGIKLVIVGGGPLLAEMKELAKALGVESHVIFTGFRPWKEIGLYYQLGDVFVNASITETQGLTFAEAMAAGLPIVAKKDPSIENIVENDITGIIFEDDKELAGKISKLISDKEKCQKLSEAAIKKAEELSSKTFGKKVEELYMDLLENPQKYNFRKHQTGTHYIIAKMVKSGNEIKNVSLKTRNAINKLTRIGSIISSGPEGERKD